MIKNLPVIGALSPVAICVWIAHPNTATTLIAGGTTAAAVAEHKLRSLAEARRERKAVKAAVKAAAKEQLAHEREVAEFRAQNAPQALPKPVTVIDYTAAGQEVTRASKRLV